MQRGLLPTSLLAIVFLLSACSPGALAPASGSPDGNGGADSNRGTPGVGDPGAGDPGDKTPDVPDSTPGGATGDPGDPTGGGGGGGGGGVDPAPGNPQPVEPIAGQLDPHPVQLEEIQVRVAGRHAVLNVIWWSGVEPCYVLDSVRWELDPATNTIAIALMEGRGPGDQMCIEIAVQKVTAIDLGDLEPGTYTVTAVDGGAPDVSFTIE